MPIVASKATSIRSAKQMKVSNMSQLTNEREPEVIKVALCSVSLLIDHHHDALNKEMKIPSML